MLFCGASIRSSTGHWALTRLGRTAGSATCNRSKRAIQVNYFPARSHREPTLLSPSFCGGKLGSHDSGSVHKVYIYGQAITLLIVLLWRVLFLPVRGPISRVPGLQAAVGIPSRGVVEIAHDQDIYRTTSGQLFRCRWDHRVLIGQFSGNNLWCERRQFPCIESAVYGHGRQY